MKLIYCQNCGEVKSLVIGETTYCGCLFSWGRYEDNLTATYGGGAMPLGFDNATLSEALRHQPDKGEGKRFEAFVIPKECQTFIRKRTPNP